MKASTFSFLFLIILLSFLQLELQAQDSKVKSMAFENYERKLDNPDDLTLLTKEYKEFDVSQRIIKFVVHRLNPGGELKKSSEVSKSWTGDGRIEEISKFDEMGDLIKKEKITYNKKNKKIEVEYSEPFLYPEQTFTKIYAYTDYGDSESVLTTNQDGDKVSEEKWKYNKEGEEIRYEKWDKRGSTNYELDKKMVYNKDGSLDRAEKIETKGEDVFKEVTIFDGYKVKEKQKYKNGKLVSDFGGSSSRSGGLASGGQGGGGFKTLIDFGSDKDSQGDGGFGGYSNFGGGGLMMGAIDEEEEFNDKGQKTKVTQTLEGEITQIVHYIYDANDNLTNIKTIFYQMGEEAGSEEEVTEYDEQSNLVRKASYKNDYLMLEEKYDYTYFQ